MKTKKKVKGGKMCKLTTKVENGCNGNKGTKCVIPYVMPYATANKNN